MTSIRISRISAGILGAACLLALPLHAADASLARNLAAACANCHGTDGQSQGGMPSLAGQDKGYMVRQLQDFKTGKRPATIMHQLAKGYTDEQFELIAGYFAGLKTSAPAPRMGY